MSSRTLLFVMNSATPDAEIAAMAEMTGRDETHLVCLLVDPTPALPAYAYGIPPYGAVNIPDNWQLQVQQAHNAQQTRVDEVEKLLAHHGTSGQVMGTLTASLHVKHQVARCARVSDEAVFANNLRETPHLLREAISGVLFHSPIGFQVNANTAHKPTHVFIAWDSSPSAAAAVHRALPYLKNAQEVVIGCIDPIMTPEHDGQDPGTDLAAWLSHHGCTVTVSQYPSGERSISDCIQDRARETGADLIVMGAYARGRMIQTVLGGTTRSMVEQTERPVFFAH